jgi:hypothetical protein
MVRMKDDSNYLMRNGYDANEAIHRMEGMSIVFWWRLSDHGGGVRNAYGVMALAQRHQNRAYYLLSDQ